MVSKSTSFVGLFDFVLIGVPVHPEDLVVVLPLALLELLLGVAQELAVLKVSAVHPVDVLVVPDSFLEFLKLHVGLGPSQIGLDVGAVQAQGNVAILN